MFAKPGSSYCCGRGRKTKEKKALRWSQQQDQQIGKRFGACLCHFYLFSCSSSLHLPIVVVQVFMISLWHRVATSLSLPHLLSLSLSVFLSVQICRKKIETIKKIIDGQKQTPEMDKLPYVVIIFQMATVWPIPVVAIRGINSRKSCLFNFRTF